MAKEKKVEQITDMEVDFAQWYTDVCRKAELVEYASVKGFTILRPYGYAIWENMGKRHVCGVTGDKIKIDTRTGEYLSRA